MLGGVLSASAISGVMSGCKAEPKPGGWTPEFFTAKEGNILDALVERIIPRTDTPGAKDAGVPAFIDSMMTGFYGEKEKTAFREGLNKVEEDAKAAYNKSFTDLSPEQQDELLTKYDQEAYAEDSDRQSPHFFRTAKELTILGFCTSEPGASQFLKYEAVPGDYKGCIPYSDVGAAWATS